MSRSSRARTTRRAFWPARQGRRRDRSSKTRLRRRGSASWAAHLLAAIAIVMPGIGPIVADGPLAAGLGEAAGHLAGGVARTLETAGVPRPEAEQWEAQIREGAVLVGAHVKPAEVDGARDVYSEPADAGVCRGYMARLMSIEDDWRVRVQDKDDSRPGYLVLQLRYRAGLRKMSLIHSSYPNVDANRHARGETRFRRRAPVACGLTTVDRMSCASCSRATQGRVGGAVGASMAGHAGIHRTLGPHSLACAGQRAGGRATRRASRGRSCGWPNLVRAAVVEAVTEAGASEAG